MGSQPTLTSSLHPCPYLRNGLGCSWEFQESMAVSRAPTAGLNWAQAVGMGMESPELLGGRVVEKTTTLSLESLEWALLCLGCTGGRREDLPPYPPCSFWSHRLVETGCSTCVIFHECPGRIRSAFPMPRASASAAGKGSIWMSVGCLVQGQYQKERVRIQKPPARSS